MGASSETQAAGRMLLWDVVINALLAEKDHVIEISVQQEDRMVDRIKAALASCTIQTASSDTPPPGPAVGDDDPIPDEIDNYALVDWDFVGSGND